MAHAGQIIENPVSGERITFLQTSADTNGERLAIELELTPDGHTVGMPTFPPAFIQRAARKPLAMIATARGHAMPALASAAPP